MSPKSTSWLLVDLVLLLCIITGHAVKLQSHDAGISQNGYRRVVMDEEFVKSASMEFESTTRKTNLLTSFFEKEELCDRSGLAAAATLDLVIKRDLKSSIKEPTVFDFMEMNQGQQDQYNSTLQSGRTIYIDNLGFAYHDESPATRQLPAVEKADARLPGALYPLQDTLGQNLYHFMATDGLPEDALAGKRILEVGSGRGKGAAYLAQQFKPKTLVGLDLNYQRVELARKYWGHTDNLEFVVGNAMDLPLKSKSFDVVFNVESSFHYPDFGKFVQEVHRVLVPGGLFVWTAPLLNRGESLAQKQRVFEMAGFRISKKMDITSNVILSRQRWAKDSSSQELNLACTTVLYDFVDSKPLRAPFNFWEFFGIPGSLQYKNFVDGKIPYIRFIALK